MNKCAFCLLVMIAVVVVGCSTGEVPDDRTAIDLIADDLGAAVSSGDLMMVDKHLSHRAKLDGFEANRFLMECSLGESLTPELTARTIKVMGDSAHLTFVVMPTDSQFSDSLSRSLVRLMKSREWKIVSFDLIPNLPMAEPDSLVQPADSLIEL